MALVRSVAWGSLTKAILDEAFEFAGGKLATIHAESGAVSGYVGGWILYVGDGTDNRIAGFALGGSSDRCYVNANANDSTTVGSGYSWASTNVRVVATKHAVAIMNIDANGCSKMGVVITTDSNNDLCCVVCGSDAQTLANPAVVPRDLMYTAKVQYMASTATNFGATALSKIPVPSFDGNARWLPNVCFAHATQYQVDGSVMLNQKTRFYCVGGSWFINDDNAEG